MRTNTNQFAKEVPLPSNYGAAELIVSIRRNTVKSFTSAALIFAIALSGIYVYLIDQGIDPIDRITNGGITTVMTFAADKPNPTETVTLPLPPVNTSLPTSIMGTGLEEVAGNVVGVEDSKILTDVKFANIENLGVATSKSGNGILAQNNINETPAINTIPKMVEATEANIEDNSEIIIPVDKEPYVDLVKLAKSITYPEIALKAGVQGKVYVNVLIDELGNVKKTKIAQSDNSLLNQAAIDAVHKYGQFEPARQQGQAIKYWLTIPIDFRLR